jgi:hypothetical protein
MHIPPPFQSRDAENPQNFPRFMSLLSRSEAFFSLPNPSRKFRWIFQCQNGFPIGKESVTKLGTAARYPRGRYVESRSPSWAQSHGISHPFSLSRAIYSQNLTCIGFEAELVPRFSSNMTFLCTSLQGLFEKKPVPPR